MNSSPSATFNEFITIPELLGNDFAGPSWDAWKVTMKGALGESMSAAERARFRELTNRDPAPGRVRDVAGDRQTRR